MTVPFVSRATVMSSRGVAASTSPLAASTGIRIMSEGGNAFDAAIAMAAAETVTVPSMCGLGGEVFAIFYEAKTGKVKGLTSTGVAPKGATPSFFRSKGYTHMPEDGPLAASPPGEVAAYQFFVDNLCTLPLERLLEPAIGYAEDGYPVTPRISRLFDTSFPRVSKIPSLAKIFLRNGKPYGAGEILVQKDLGSSLRKVAKGGAEEFYKGQLASDIAKRFQEAGGLITEETLAAHEIEVYEPLSTEYRGYTVVENRPPSQGMLILEMLNIIEGFDLAGMGHLSPQSIHTMIEAKKLAFADRNAYLGDTKSKEIPLDVLISKEYANNRRSLINADKASFEVGQGSIQPLGKDTSYFCVADGEGNAVSFIHSLYQGFGSGFVAEGTGIVFNARQRGFRLEEGHPNTVSPGQRPMHTLNAYMVLKDNFPVLIGGTPGADFQPQGNTQMITGVLDYGLSPQEAIDAPRWSSIPGTDPPTLGDPEVVQMEPRMPQEIAVELESKGHQVQWGQEGISHGIVQLIQMDKATGTLKAGSDPRGDGHAAAL
tara:strand:- start:4995 stop:6620 length:1626 start_codon:yes stop_codon:yes gene_type:complete